MALVTCFYASSLSRVDNLCETLRNQWLANWFGLRFDLLAYLRIKSEENSALSQKIMQLNLSKPQIFVAMYIVTRLLLLSLPPASHKFSSVLCLAPTPLPVLPLLVGVGHAHIAWPKFVRRQPQAQPVLLLLLLLLQDARSQDQKQAAASPAAVAVGLSQSCNKRTSVPPLFRLGSGLKLRLCRVEVECGPGLGACCDAAFNFIHGDIERNEPKSNRLQCRDE